MPLRKTLNNLLINSRVIFPLSLLFMVFVMQATATPVTKKKKMVADTMVVMEVIPAEKGKIYAEVTFTRSARIYRISTKANPAYMKLLKESASKHTAVLIERAKIESDEILSVKKVQKK